MRVVTGTLGADVPVRSRGWRLWLPLLLPALLMELGWLALWLGYDTATRPKPFQGLFALVFVAYCAALLGALRLVELDRRVQVAIVVAGALLFQLTLLPAPYAFSDDIFRYVWDGRVSAAGIDPYRYAPGDPALAWLRDDAIWRPVNAKEQPSPYPPLMEALFALGYRVAPDSLLGMKATMVVVNMGVVGLLLALLWRRGAAPLLALVYAWNPQTIFQVGFSGHNEPLMLFWILAALLLGELGTARGRLLGGWALALAVLSKLIPLLALPVLLRRWGWQAALAFCATLAGIYGALLARGLAVFGGVAYEAQTAVFNDGLYHLIARAGALVGSPEELPRLLSNVLLALLALGLALRRGGDLALPLGTLMAAYVLLAPSVPPWYVLWVLPFVALDALPRLGRRDGRPQRVRLLAGFWLLFSWTAIVSELFYFQEGESRYFWPILHLLEYVIPLMVMGWGWWRWRLSGRGAAGDPGTVSA